MNEQDPQHLRSHQFAPSHRRQSNPPPLTGYPPPLDAEDGTALAASYSTAISQITPARSFYHRAFRSSLDAGHYSTQEVRQETAGLASLAVTDGVDPSSKAAASFGSNQARLNVPVPTGTSPLQHAGALKGRSENQEASISRSLETDRSPSREDSTSNPLTTSALTTMLRNSPPENYPLPTPFTTLNAADASHAYTATPSSAALGSAEYPEDDTETAQNLPLIPSRRPSQPRTSIEGGPEPGYGSIARDIESDAPLAPTSSPRSRGIRAYLRRPRTPWKAIESLKLNTRSCNYSAIWNGIIRPVHLLPSVFLGLLLNILDALSYGMILFPIGSPVFSSLGVAGISIFYISTIVAQLVFSFGGSIFKGGIGSEMIEVVPFFHKMAYMILERVGEDNPRAVLATSVLSFAISAIITGLVFFCMGFFGLGTLIGFFPRHILIGCIGGVGWFLIATGIEVSGRLSGSLEYNLPMLRHLLEPHTLVLWTSPLAVALSLLVLKRYITSNFLVGGYFLAITLAFYLITSILGVSMEKLRNDGWVFQAPASNEPWYTFYDLYSFRAVDWSALAQTVPTMFALTFFGILHVPINVPALGISTGEDNLDVNRELIAHGISNTLSGFMGSIQNYLVYTNSLLFIASGGTDRLAGVMLAIATFGVLCIGPVIIGYIPIMIVGGLIYLLGIELMEEALIDTRGKLQKLEYLTIIVIIVTMGAFDFVQGIVVGIILACVSYVIQAARKHTIKATYSGEVASSTVRRHPLHVRFLKEAGKLTHVVKLTGFLFFGTIVDVEKYLRGLIEDKMLARCPIRYLVLDFSRVNGIDFSAAEAFTRIHRVLSKRDVHMILCGLDLTGDVAAGLQNVGLFSAENNIPLFEDLNAALEYCENELLKILYDDSDAIQETHRDGQNLPSTPSSAEIAISSRQLAPNPALLENISYSPRHRHLHGAVANTLEEAQTSGYGLMTQNMMSTQQPLGLIVQTFEGLTNEDEAFWLPLCAYFSKRTYRQNTTLVHQGDEAREFLILESGMLRAEYSTPQGSYYELIVAGRPCGELPFFGATGPTATVKAERNTVAWGLEKRRWEELRVREPQIAQELLAVCLKMTAERMETITSYVMTTA